MFFFLRVEFFYHSEKEPLGTVDALRSCRVRCTPRQLNLGAFETSYISVEVHT